VRLPRLHVVTDDVILARSDFLDTAGRLLATHGPAIALHVRGPRTSARRLLAAASALAAYAAEAGATLLVNDRIDVAIAAGAHGVHLGGRSISPADARPLVGDRLLGRSIHAAVGVAAVARWTDFLFLGTIYPTPSHPDVAALGTGVLGGLTDRAGVPVLAIGGITQARVGEVVGAGAYGVAVIRAVWAHGDPVENAGTMVRTIGKVQQRE
jgi:thiamine-phosphate diphosphorylase